MKALEILNLLKCNKNMKILRSLRTLKKDEIAEYLNNAISELETLQQPKSCDGCKQSWKPNNQTFHKYFCEYLKIPIHGNFYCNRYEPKEKRDE